MQKSSVISGCINGDRVSRTRSTLLIQQTMVDEMCLDWSPNSYRETDKRTTEGELHQGGEIPKPTYEHKHFKANMLVRGLG